MRTRIQSWVSIMGQLKQKQLKMFLRASGRCEHLAGQAPYREVELLRLLLVSPSLGNAWLAHECFRDCGFDRLHGVAVLEAVRDIKVLNGDYVLDSLQRGFHGFLNLPQQGQRN